MARPRPQRPQPPPPPEPMYQSSEESESTEETSSETPSLDSSDIEMGEVPSPSSPPISQRNIGRSRIYSPSEVRLHSARTMESPIRAASARNPPGPSGPSSQRGGGGPGGTRGGGVPQGGRRNGQEAPGVGVQQGGRRGGQEVAGGGGPQAGGTGAQQGGHREGQETAGGGEQQAGGLGAQQGGRRAAVGGAQQGGRRDGQEANGRGEQQAGGVEAQQGGRREGQEAIRGEAQQGGQREGEETAAARKQAEGTQQEAVGTEKGAAGPEKEAGGTPGKRRRRRRDNTAGPASTRRRISPKKSTTMIIPGSKLPNGGKHPLPKGTVMEMIQVRDLEVSRLMEEIQNYEDEAAVLTHQIHVMTNEKHELNMQIQEMSRDMADMQRAASIMKLSSSIGPKITYWPDEKIAKSWETLFANVLMFTRQHCRWNPGVHDGMTRWRTHIAPSSPDLVECHFGTFNALLGENVPQFQRSVNVAQVYVRKLVSDGLGNMYPGRLDCLIGDGGPNEAIPAAIIMKILQTEIFDKIRWLLRSEAFWDPMESPALGSKSGWQNFATRTTEDVLIKEESLCANNDTVAFEFNCMRAKMVLHLATQHDTLGTIMVNYLNRVGVLILNAISPFITVDVLNRDMVGLDESKSTTLMKFEQMLNPNSTSLQRLATTIKLHKILTGAYTLALIMRSDNTITYLDGGGFNLPFNNNVMENIADKLDHFGKETDPRKKYLRSTDDKFAWLVVAPCLKRVGNVDGTGYGDARVLAKSKMILRRGDPERDIDGTDFWMY